MLASPELCLGAAAELPPADVGACSSAVQRVNPLEEPGWDDKLKSYSSASFFHSTAWARVLQDSYGYSPVYFTLDESGRLACLLAIMEVKSWLTGRRGISLPFTDDCEPVGLDAVAFGRVFQEAVAYAKARGWKYLECRGGKSLLTGALVSTGYYGHHLRLTTSDELLYSGFKSSVRRAIRKATKMGVMVEFAQNLEAVRTFYALQCQTRRKHGLPPQPFRFFENIHSQILSKDLGVLAVARYQHTPVAAAIFFHWGSKAIFKYGASDESYQHLRGNNLVMWEAIKWHARNRFELLHFGRTSLSNHGLQRFKLGWGAEESMIEYVRYDLCRDSFVTAKDEASGWQNRVFHRLPGFASRLVGAMLYEHVA